MSGSASISLEQAILGHTLGYQQMTMPASVWVALCSASMPPSETVQGIEAFGGGYTRMRASFALIDTPANIAANTTSIEWPIATASWGTLGYFELWDAATGGNRLYWGQFSPATPVTVAAGDIMRFSAGNLAVQASTGTGGTASIGAYLPLAGGSMGGPLLLSHDPTAYLEAATKQYVDAHSGTGGGPGFLPLSGGTMLGPLSLAGNATLPLHAVSLQQVDTLNVVNVLNHGAKGDGTTDDTAAIQAVLNTYAGKAVVFIPWTSASFRTGQLTIPSNTDLLLNGRLFALPGLPSGHLTSTGTGNITIRGSGSIDANGPAQTFVGGMAGLGFSNVTNLRVSGVWITNAFHWNINITASSNVVFDSVTLTKGGAANEFAAECDDCWLVNCTIDGTGLGDYAFCFYGGVTNSGAIGNVVKNGGIGTGPTSAPPGIGILSDSASPDTAQPCHNITISDNIIYNCQGPGISVQSMPGNLSSGIIINNNRCYGNNLVNVADNVANIFLIYCAEVTITGNQLSANGNASNTGVAGIYLDGTVSGVSMVGNHIYNIGQGSTNGSGIWTSATNVLASGNYVYDNQTTHTMQYAVIGGGGAHNSWVGNFFDLPVNFGTNSDTVLANSVQGVWTIDNAGGAADHIMAIISAQSHRAGLQYQTQGQLRWLVGTDGATDTGSNVGSNYVIASYNDSNVLQSPVFSINRATGKVTLAVAPTITTLPTNAANDAAAAVAGVQIGQEYRNGSIKMIRVT